MKSLYIASTTAYSGKTALALGIGLHARSRGHAVAYFKPLSVQGYYPNDLSGDVDQDAQFARRVFGLTSVDTTIIAPVRADKDLLNDLQQQTVDVDALWQRIDSSIATLRQGRDFLLIEGGGTLRDGFATGVHIRSVPERYNLPVLIVSGWRGSVLTLDDILAARELLGERLLGAIINSVPDDEQALIESLVQPYLNQHKVTLYGSLPLQPQLRAISIGELTRLLGAEILVGEAQHQRLIEGFSIGAMSVESALPILRAASNTGVITGADRADLQGAALESSSVACLILTGTETVNSHILQRAEDVGIAVLSVQDATMQALEKIERVFGKTPLGQAEKLNRFQAVLAQHLDYDRLFTDLERTKQL
jgi:uncharacterized protein